MREQTEAQKRQLVRDILRNRKGCEYDGITAMRYFIKTYGIYNDWHLYADILDGMHTNELATRINGGCDGHTKYLIN